LLKIQLNKKNHSFEVMSSQTNYETLPFTMCNHVRQCTFPSTPGLSLFLPSILWTSLVRIPIAKTSSGKLLNFRNKSASDLADLIFAHHRYNVHVGIFHTRTVNSVHVFTGVGCLQSLVTTLRYTEPQFTSSMSMFPCCVRLKFMQLCKRSDESSM